MDEDLESAAGATAAFSARLRELREGMDGARITAGDLERGFSGGVRRAFDGVALDGMKLSDALRGVAQSMVDTVYAAATRPVTDRFGELLAQGVGAIFGGVSAHADGAGFAGGRVMPFARGGVVSGPVLFPMRGGTGLMGEAGPEAILPLSRGPDGQLGVRSAGGAPVQVTMHVSTPDVAGFRRSQGQIAAELGRLVARGQRNR